ncbi:RNA polymerase sigma-70 factor (ECF subfamily) [Thermosporothrix hazakensis]|jgi:RNA polymerase sigma-70 factor (ECF subfamily)|uniref:RNA polymerase sigma factor n=1 Tax=Thermosporothrix hazakensis TaxID=644383 RepID=A0A326U2B9_THEHA|nr:RNA polymerase sigma factor [Thermosporothrix hazakensis]PZW19363.1 RNA polymerase sigma-70 factor (ECF subfamily) [Thermosporothrix hazakensis]GCE49886.1 RNA polymerase sigma factor [Thermosporothrix hazakensis]
MIARKDHAALYEFYKRYNKRLYGYLWTVLEQDRAWTEDLVQEVFLCVWHAAGSYRGEASVATWLFRIAHHLAMNAKRKRRRWLEEQPDEAEDSASYGASLEEGVIQRLHLLQAIEHLSAKHRAVLDLLFVQGFTVEEAAHILRVPVGTVKSRLSYARRSLAALLQDAELREVIPHE